VKGIELIYQRMFEVLAKLGLQPIEAVGQPFDPNVHHAIEMVESEEHADQTVLADCCGAICSRAGCCAPRW